MDALGAICDQDEAALERLKQRHPQVTTYSTLDRLLADDAIDAVVIATPSHSHGEIAHQVLSSGRHVLVEKPLCLHLADALPLKDLAESNGLTLMVGHILLYHPAYQALKRFVADGGLGEVRYMYAHRLNFRSVRSPDNALWDFAPHDISMMLDLVGELPTSVAASAGSSVDPEVSDTTLSRFEFPGGLAAHVFVSWMHPIKDQKLAVVGEQGMAIFDDVLPIGEKLLFYPHEVDWQGEVPTLNRADAVPLPFPTSEPLAAECRHFLECIETGSQPRSDFAEAWDVLSVLDACERSLLDGGRPFTEVGNILVQTRDRTCPAKSNVA